MFLQWIVNSKTSIYLIFLNAHWKLLEYVDKGDEMNWNRDETSNRQENKFTWRFISAAFQNEPIWMDMPSYSIWVAFTWYFITRNEISFLSKWSIWNPYRFEFQVKSWLNIELRFSTKMKSNIGLSSFCLSCEHVLKKNPTRILICFILLNFVHVCFIVVSKICPATFGVVYAP